MEKTYHPADIEQKHYQTWEKNGYFKPSHEGTPYCIMIPPPNVTGSLHMGHGFQDSLMDALIRYHRMCGHNTLWQVGTDHAGISTQMVVERLLEREGSSKQALGRSAFTDRIWAWKNESGSMITKQLRRMGASVDWERERFTMDERCSKAVQTVFVRLYEEGLIYRGKKLVNWDPHFKTAISDLEVTNHEEQGSLWHIRYPFADGSGHLVVATTRPETMFGDVAVAVHPNDSRYQKFINKTIQLPLTNRTISVIADEFVMQEFGSGVVKITPAHDFTDYEVGIRLDLPLINILTPDAKTNENVPETYRHLDRFDARKKVIEDLEKLGLIEKIEPYKLQVPRAERSHSIVEPYLTDQWFIKMETLAKPAIEAVQSGQIKLVPDTWNKTYFQWLDNIQDWCISRQLWWGHRIPAWHDPNGNIYVGFNEADIRQKHQLPQDLVLTQEEDVLDTWFSSALWPFSTLGWPDNTPELETFFPTNVLVTGFDIIFFWVARMIMMSLKFTGQIPFKEVYITGLIRDSEGHKMSKTKGNVLDPIDLIDGIDLESLIKKRTYGLMQPGMAERITKSTQKEFPDGIPPSGTDALRFTYCALASTGRDIRFDLHRLEGYRNFCNKLWNAARYVLMNIEGFELEKPCEYSIFDQWIQSRLQSVIQKVHDYYKIYRFDLVAQTIYEFVWNEYCDWYLELVKPILTNPNSTAVAINGTRKTLVSVLGNILLLLHPMMPFITEEIWQNIKSLVGKNAPSIMLESFPQVNKDLINEQLESEVTWLQQVITGLRTIRSEMNVSPAKQIDVLLNKGQPIDRERIEKHSLYLKALAKINSLNWLESSNTPPSATCLVGELELLIPLAGLIDKTAEVSRLTKEIDKLQQELVKSLGRLENPNYTAKAPEAVVNKERERVAELQFSKQKLEEKLTEISSL
ncbi:MAG: valine--tRNA ligase [Gammaproteobacteria bacterium]